MRFCFGVKFRIWKNFDMCILRILYYEKEEREIEKSVCKCIWKK